MLCAKSVPYRYTHTEAQLMVGDNSRDEDYLGNCSEKPVISSTYCAHKALKVEMCICFWESHQKLSVTKYSGKISGILYLSPGEELRCLFN